MKRNALAPTRLWINLAECCQYAKLEISSKWEELLTLRKRIVVTAALFVVTLLLHSVLIFSLFPRAQLLKYPKTAEHYLQNKLSEERLLDFSPLYLQVHILAQSYFERPNYAVQYLHLILTSLSVCLLFQILLHFFPLSIAIGGSITFLLDRTIILYTQAFEPEPVMIFLLLAFLILIIQSSPRSHLAAGMILGLAVWTRPNFLPMLLVIPIYFYFRNSNRLLFLRSSLLCCLPVVIALLGLSVRNGMLTGSYSPAVMNAGTAMFEGNNPVSWGLSAIYPPLVEDVSNLHQSEVDYHHEVYRIFARKITGKKMTLLDVNRYWISKAFNFLVDHPGHAVQLFATKFFHFFHNFLWHDLSNAFWNEKLLRNRFVPTVPFAFVSAMALFGLWVGRSRWKGFLIFYGMFGSQFLFMMAIYVSARQRASIISLFIFFACAGIHFLMQRRSWFRWLVIVLPLSILLYLRTDLMLEETRLWEKIRISKSWLDSAYQKRGQDRWKEASEEAARALAAIPFCADSCRPANLSFGSEGFPIAAYDLISAFDFSSQFDRAVLSFEARRGQSVKKNMNTIISSGVKLKRDYYQSSQPYYYLGYASLFDGEKKEAEQNFKIALERSPGDPWILASLSQLTGDERYRKQLFRYLDDIDAHFFLGEAALRFGNGEGAVRSFTYVTKMIPEYRRGWIHLAAAYAKLKRYKEGSETYKHALKMNPDPVLLENEILELFENLAKQNPQDPVILQTSGFVFRQFGHYLHAMELQKAALKITDSKAIRSEIATLEKALAAYGSKSRSIN